VSGGSHGNLTGTGRRVSSALLSALQEAALDDFPGVVSSQLPTIDAFHTQMRQ